MGHTIALVAAFAIGLAMVSVYIRNSFHSLNNIGKHLESITPRDACQNLILSLLMTSGSFALWALDSRQAAATALVSVLGGLTFIGFARTVLGIDRYRLMWGNYRAFASVLAYVAQTGLVVALVFLV